MTSASAVRSTVLMALVCGLGGSLHAAAGSDPARSFRLVERLEGPRVISWQAVSREPGGHFVLWRIGQDAQQVARFDALPGAHAYRFVDNAASAGAGFLVYRLAYEAGDGKGNLLLVATLAQNSLSDGSTLPSASPVPVVLEAASHGLHPLATSAALPLGRGSIEFFEFSGPEPPPPRG